MKKILLIILMLWCAVSYGQKPNYSYYPTRGNFIAVMGDSALHMAIGCGKPLAYNAYATKIWPHGAAIYGDTCNNKLYFYRNHSWVFIPDSAYVASSGTDTTNKWVNTITRIAGKDSIFFNIGGNWYKIKDSSGGAVDTFVLATRHYVDSSISEINLLTENVPGNASAKAISFVDADTLKLKGMADGIYTIVTTGNDSANKVSIDTASLRTFIVSIVESSAPRQQLAYAGVNGNGTDLLWLDTAHHRLRYIDTTNSVNYGIAITDSLDATEYDPDAQNYIDAVNATDVTLTVPQKQAINDYIIGLKADGLWSLIYEQGFPIWGTANSSAVMMKGLHTTTWVNSPTFGSTGVTGNGSSQYGELNFSPSTAYSSANDAHLAVYIQDNQTNSSYVDIGSNDGSSVIRINSKAGAATATYLNNISSGSAATVSTSVGFTLVNRSSSTTLNHYKNGSFITNDANTSSGLSTQEIYILAGNQVGSPGVYSARTLSAWSIGDALDATQVGNLSTRINAFMTALGINVY